MPKRSISCIATPEIVALTTSDEGSVIDRRGNVLAPARMAVR
jgi:hypothetical protein